MRLRSITLFVKDNGMVGKYLFKGYRRFYGKLRGCDGQGLRVLVRYWDDKNEYKEPPVNDTGWYKNKTELVKAVKAFLKA